MIYTFSFLLRRSKRYPNLMLFLCGIKYFKHFNCYSKRTTVWGSNRVTEKNSTWSKNTIYVASPNLITSITWSLSINRYNPVATKHHWVSMSNHQLYNARRAPHPPSLAMNHQISWQESSRGPQDFSEHCLGVPHSQIKTKQNKLNSEF